MELILSVILFFNIAFSSPGHIKQVEKNHTAIQGNNMEVLLEESKRRLSAETYSTGFFNLKKGDSITINNAPYSLYFNRGEIQGCFAGKN